MKICLAILLAHFFAKNAAAANHSPQPPLNCRPIHGYLTADFTTENCASPVGICTKGRVWGDPLFLGTTNYSVENVAGSPIDPTMATSLSYSGTLTIHTRLGDVTIPDLGLMDKKAALVSSQSRDMSATGKLSGLYGVFFTTGRTTATGFRTEIHGRACFKRENLTP